MEHAGALSRARKGALCADIDVGIPFGSSPAVYIRFKSTNSSNDAMWWDDIALTLVGCDC